MFLGMPPTKLFLTFEEKVPKLSDVFLVVNKYWPGEETAVPFGALDALRSAGRPRVGAPLLAD